MKYASIDISTNVFLKCVYKDVFTACISTNVFMSISTGEIGVHTTLQNLLLQHFREGVTMTVSLQSSLPVSTG